MADHCHAMSEASDSEEHEKMVKEFKLEAPEEEQVADVVKKAPAVEAGSIDADVAAEAERQRNTPEYKEAIAAIAKSRNEQTIELAKARLEVEIEKLKADAIIPDGVRLVTKGVTAVPRDPEPDAVLAKRSSKPDFAGM
jgi:hypothetical protein